MSEQNPPGTPAEGPDPFAELLKGLIEEPTAEQPAAAPAPAEPVQPAAAPAPEQPATSSADLPTVAFTPFETPAVVPPSVEQSAVTAPPLEEPTVAFSPAPAAAFPEPTSAFPEPTAVLPEPIAASGTPSSGLAPTVVLPGAIDPTAATTVLAGGAGGGLPPSEPPKGGGFRDWDPRRKALFITLVSIAGVLLIALVILLIVLLGGNKGDQPTPTTSPTGTSTPTPTRSATPTPTPTPTVKPAVQSFTVNSNTAVCADTGAGTNVTMHFAWTVVGNPTQIAIASAPNAIDAIANPFQNNLPATATDFQMPFGCSNAQLTYSLTIAGPDGQHYSGVVTVVRQYTPPAPVPTNPTITQFTVERLDSNVCDPNDPTVTPFPRIRVVWATKDAIAVEIPELPGSEQLSGSSELDYDCAGEGMVFSITATGASGTTPATGTTSILRPVA